MDIPPLVLNRYFKIPVSKSIYVFDMLILLLQAFDSTGEQLLMVFCGDCLQRGAG